ncbi:hypothetical protein DQX05_17960 [Paenibacillus thiaminolyticus]|uniref:Uncharacterized protein n=1 Tax=Paenibacillus thiaminolyticus TaxID=49283 RepID=A0A3A3H0K6_PANTH|nr:hypothetical protein DQX05_17960 [Paenibacillus thiaminolyticus]
MDMRFISLIDDNDIKKMSFLLELERKAFLKHDTILEDCIYFPRKNAFSKRWKRFRVHGRARRRRVQQVLSADTVYHATGSNGYASLHGLRG